MELFFFDSEHPEPRRRRSPAELDELIRVGEAENTFIGIEHPTEKEVEEFRSLRERAAQAHDQKQKAQASRSGNLKGAG